VTGLADSLHGKENYYSTAEAGGTTPFPRPSAELRTSVTGLSSAAARFRYEAVRAARASSDGPDDSLSAAALFRRDGDAFQVGNHFIEQGAFRPEFCEYFRNVHV